MAGTDELGRDTLSRLLWGARLSLAVSVSVVAVSLALGLSIGGLAGYLGGWVDTALTTFAMNTFLALPGILLAIAFAAFLGPGFSNLVLALAIGGWAGYARLVRAQVMAVRDREYVDAARALGASGMRIFFRHILPNIVQPILVQAVDKRGLAKDLDGYPLNFAGPEREQQLDAWETAVVVAAYQICSAAGIP